MLPNIVANVYCHKCGKICSSNIKKRPLAEVEAYVKKWLECPYCIDCLRMPKFKIEFKDLEEIEDVYHHLKLWKDKIGETI